MHKSCVLCTDGLADQIRVNMLHQLSEAVEELIGSMTGKAFRNDGQNE